MGSEANHLETSDTSFSVAVDVYPERGSSDQIWSKQTATGSTGTGVGLYNNGSWTVYFYDGAGNRQLITFSSGVDLNKWQNIIFVFDYENSVGKIYKNGVEVASGSATGFSAAAGQTLYLGRLSYSGSFYSQTGINNFRIFNKALTATEVKELYSGASVPYKYKGASQTNLATNGDAETFEGHGGVTGWYASTHTYAQENSTIHSGSYSQKATAVSTTSLFSGPINNISMTKGKEYRWSAWCYSETASRSITVTVRDDANQTESSASETVGASWTEITGTFTASADATVADVLISVSATSGDVYYFDDVSLVPIGAVAEYDGSGAGEKIWGDKSGNDLHGTVSGATLENTPYDSGTEYEEGEWTAVVSDGSTPFTMNSSNTTGYYTKVGNLVTVSGYFITTSANGLTSEAIRITGLPFTIANDSAAYSGGAAAEGYNYAITAGHSVSYYGGVNSTNIYLNVWDSTGGISGMRADEWTDNGRIIIGFSYRAA